MSLIRLHEMRKEYGDIIGLKFALQNVVVLNSYKHVREYVSKIFTPLQVFRIPNNLNQVI